MKALFRQVSLCYVPDCMFAGVQGVSGRPAGTTSHLPSTSVTSALSTSTGGEFYFFFHGALSVCVCVGVGVGVGVWVGV